METEDKNEQNKLSEKVKRIGEINSQIEKLIESRRANNNLILNAESLDDVKGLISEALTLLRAITGNVSLTDRERQSLQGTRARRYGFIDRLADIAGDNMRYAPADWDVEELRNFVRQIERLRNIEAELMQLTRSIGDQLLLTNNEAYRMALLYYGSVRNFANMHDDGAKALFAMLREFFTSRRTRTSGMETKAHTKRDVNALLDGRRDGKIVIENESPHTTEGKHVVIDETHKHEMNNFKETVEGVICSECGTHNAAHAKFCINCGTKL